MLPGHGCKGSGLLKDFRFWCAVGSVLAGAGIAGSTQGGSVVSEPWPGPWPSVGAASGDPWLLCLSPISGPCWLCCRRLSAGDLPWGPVSDEPGVSVAPGVLMSPCLVWYDRGWCVYAFTD